MTESSFPIVDAKLSDAAWGQTVGAVGNGILDDWGNPYAMTVNTNDTVTIKRSSSGRARAVVNGFGHQIDADVTLSVPAVSSRTWYHIGLLYDPSNAALPVKLVVLKGDTVPLADGQEFLPLYMFLRYGGQTLAASTLYSPRPRVRPTSTVGAEADILAVSPLLFLYSTEVFCTTTRATFRAGGTTAAPEWVRISGSAWVDFNASYTGFSGGSVVYSKKRVTAGSTEVAFEYLMSKDSAVNNPALVLPEDPASWLGGSSPVGTVQLVDANGRRYDGVAILSSGSARALYFDGGPPSWEVGITGTSPFTWAVNDRIRFNLRYPTA